MSHHVCSTRPLAGSSTAQAPRIAAVSPSPMQMVSVLMRFVSRVVDTDTTLAKEFRCTLRRKLEEATRQKPAASPGGNPDRFPPDISGLLPSSHSSVSPSTYESTPPIKQRSASPE